MTSEEQIKKIISYLKSDLEDCKNLKFACFPIFMTVSSGIDFIGGLIHEEGFGSTNSGNSKKRYVLFLKEYMGQIKPVYLDNNFAEYLYDYLRCKISHEVCINGDLHTENNDNFISQHLKFYQAGNSFRIYLHPNEFKNDFLKALSLFLKKFDRETDFKNSAIQKYENRASTIETSVARLRTQYPFGLEQTEYVSSDSTSYQRLRIELSGDTY